MPVSIVVGGQFGSEGKGKTALEIVRRSELPVIVIRVGGPNSGHTAYDRSGKKHVLRQLPAACIDQDVEVVLPAASFIDVDVLEAEIAELGYPKERIHIARDARIVREEHREWEKNGNLTTSIGSTGSGVGAAVMAAVARGAENFGLPAPRASDERRLAKYVNNDVNERVRCHLDEGKRVVIEGTQGFGLSLYEGGYWPQVTSRCTTAAGALSESGLSPVDVDDITMVIRSYPIRVAGKSGPLKGETTWEVVSKAAEGRQAVVEYTSVTGRARRVGTFDAELVRRALVFNAPTRLVLNHMDYLGSEEELVDSTSGVRRFLDAVEAKIKRRVDWLGFSGRDFTRWMKDD